MSNFSTNEFKFGLKFISDGDPCSIMVNELVKPGKGQAFNRVKYRNLRTGRVHEKTFKSGESVKGANVMEINLDYSYTDDKFWYFMDPVTFEQHGASASAIASCKGWLKEQCSYTVTQWNGTPLSVIAPNFINLRVISMDPSLCGDISCSCKFAILETSAVVRVPLFIQIGELLRIDTRNSEYVERAKIR